MGRWKRKKPPRRGMVVCRTCDGIGEVRKKKGHVDGKTVEIDEPCKPCGGCGWLDR